MCFGKIPTTYTGNVTKVCYALVAFSESVVLADEEGFEVRGLEGILQ